jgi:hypothetical protein
MRCLYRPFLIVLFSALSLLGCSDSNNNSVNRPESAATPTTPPSDCFWVGPWAKENEELNFGRLDEGAVYWLALYSIPEEGDYLSFEHEFAHSRYMSATTYGVAGGVIDYLTDRDFVPNSGSTNPFVEGTPRNDPQRRYVLRIASGDPVEDSGPATENILYDGTSAAGDITVMFYRLYATDADTDIAGDAGLPRVTLYMKDGSIAQGQEACDQLVIPYDPAPFYIPPEVYADLRGGSDPSENPTIFRSSYGQTFQFRCDFGGDCSNNPPRDPYAGFGNPDAAYMYSFLNREYGEVLVLRGRIPEVPQTLDGADAVFMEQELRYWSMCEYEYYSQKVSGCLFDEQVTINDDGFYTIVTTRGEDRPENATEECGVSFIPWPLDGDGFGIVEGRESNPNDAYMTIRNILPAEDFDQVIQNTSVSGDEEEVMGEHLPKGQYFTKAEFEGLGCNPWLALPYDQM